MVHVRRSSAVVAHIGENNSGVSDENDEGENDNFGRFVEHLVGRSVHGSRWTDVGVVDTNANVDSSRGDVAVILVFGTDPSRNLERNRRGLKLVECDEVIRVERGYLGEEDKEEKTGQDNDEDNNDDDVAHNLAREAVIDDKDRRHRIFAEWLVKTFGTKVLSTGSGVLDVAGGNGELSRALSDMGVPAMLLDPEPRCSPHGPSSDDCDGRSTEDEGNHKNDKPQFEILAFALHGDGTSLTDRNDRTGNLVRQCSAIVGMHPDQATEPILDTALRLGVPFAVLPCCVMPSLFPHRRQKRHGDSVRSYSAFCRYLLDKAPEGVVFRLGYLPFVGRNKVIFSQIGIVD